MGVRLFAAVWPDQAAREALAAQLDDIREDTTGVHWQPPHRWHITLAFLGPGDPDRTAARISAAGRRHPSPLAGPLQLSGSGTFGPIVWVGVEHGPWLPELAAQLQRAMHTPDRRFRAHVTVGRVRGPAALPNARAAAALMGGHSGPTWIPSELTLVASTTGPKPEYRIVDQWPLPTSSA